MAGSTLLFSEVLDKVHKAKTKDQKVKILREHNTPALKSIIKTWYYSKIIDSNYIKSQVKCN